MDPAASITAAAPQPSAPSGRRPGFDVVRGVALIGVVVMNYHGYLNGDAESDAPSLAERVFHIRHGVLTTRFAAVFVMVAGVGVVLLTNRAVASGDPSARSQARWRLIRRGVLLLGFGFVLDWIWDGTILFYYGALFIVAGFLFPLRIRWLATVGAVSVLAAWAIRLWIEHLVLTDGDSSWWFASASERSPRGLVLDIFVNGTHPLFPWLAFFCTGMIIGRLVPELHRHRTRLLLLGAGLLAGGYALATVIRLTTKSVSGEFATDVAALADTTPWGRLPLYVVTTLGSSILAVVGVSWVGDRWADHVVVDQVRRAGQMTLTLYVLHVLVFDEVVNQRHWITPTGLDTALTFAIGFWVAAVTLAALWNRRFGRGPLEVVYRRFGG